MGEIFLGIILTGIEALCCDLFFQTFSRERYEKKRWLHAGIDILLVVAWLILAIYEKTFWIKSVCGTMIMAVLMMILYRVKVSQILFCAICYEGIVLGMDTGLLAVLQYFMSGTIDDILQKDGKIVLLWILFKLILFLCIVVINRRFSKRDYLILKEKEWVRFWVFPIFSVISIFFMLADEKIEQKTTMVLALGLLGTNIILFYLIRDFTERAEESKRISLLQEQRKNQIEMYESLELSYNQQKKKVHEFKNHLDCIQGLLKENRQEEALEYVSKINNPAEQHMSYFSTLNPVVDVVINQKYQQSQEEGIPMVMILDELSTIPIEDKDMVILLSNLLNNAIEACRKLDVKDRIIKFKFVQDKEQIIISIKNPIKKQPLIVDNQIKTTKDNEEEHGIGLYNIEEVIKKYRGEGIFNTEQGIFSYTIIFRKRRS